jgi:hypothetical protein
LPNINIKPVQGPAGAGQREVSYSDDDDTLSEYSSHGKQHDFLRKKVQGFIRGN